jgi:hypothetical protein
VQQQAARLSDVIEEQPLPALLAALGIGYLLGRLTVTRQVSRLISRRA